MSELGLASAVRDKVKRTTTSDPKAAKPHDLVGRYRREQALDRGRRLVLRQRPRRVRSASI